MTTENGLFFYQEKSFGKNPALEMRKKPGEIMVKSPLKLFIDLDLWFFTDSTMVNHHEQPPFGRIFFCLFQAS